MAQPHHSVTQPKSTISIFFAAGGGMSLIMAVILLVLTLMSVQNYQDAARLAADGVDTVARVTDRKVERRRTENGTRTSYYVTFTYDVAGEPYSHRDSVSSHAYNRYSTGQTVSFRYWAQDPTVAERHIGETLEDAKSHQKLALGAGILALAALWWYGRRSVNAVLARRFGTLTTATITDITERRHKGRRTGQGHANFVSPDGIHGTSFRHSMSHLNRIGVGGTLRVYQRRGQVFWEGDVGPRKLPPPSVPQVGS